LALLQNCLSIFCFFAKFEKIARRFSILSTIAVVVDPNSDFQSGRFPLTVHALRLTTFCASIGAREVTVVRVIAGLLLLCLTATHALSDGAVSFGAAGSNTAFYGISLNQKTRVLAIADANAKCAAQALTKDVTEKCMVQSTFQNRCVGIIALRTFSGRTAVGTTLYAQTGSDEREARVNATAVCTDVARVYTGLCEMRATACDITDEGTNARIGQWVTKTLDAATSGWADKFDAIGSWWHDTVTTTFLVVSAAFLILSGALLYTTIQLRRLKRVIAPPPVRRSKRAWRPFGAFRGIVTNASRKMKEPFKGPVLNERTIREAFERTQSGERNSICKPGRSIGTGGGAIMRFSLRSCMVEWSSAPERIRKAAETTKNVVVTVSCHMIQWRRICQPIQR
jgi:Domain of unknown function (DUF4189)